MTKDSFFEHYGCVGIAIVIIGAMFFIGKCCSDYSTKKEAEDDRADSIRHNTLGKYVYMTRDYVLHSRITCVDLDSAVERIAIKDLEWSNLNYCCTWCIDDNLYDKLEAIAKSHIDTTYIDEN